MEPAWRRIGLLRGAAGLVRRACRAVARGYAFHRAHGATVRWARTLCEYADGLVCMQPRDWERRSERLFGRVSKLLADIVKMPPGLTNDEVNASRGREAHRVLYLSRTAYRNMGWGLLALGTSVVAAAWLLVLMGCLLSPTVRYRVFPRDLAAGQRWTTSSADPGNPLSGIGPSGSGPLFFHTQSSDHPWLEIDLGDVHLVRSIRVVNRQDCCRERALPLNFEIFDGQRWQLAAQRRSPFSVWDSGLRPVRTRRVRVRLAGSGFLHLKAVSVYGQ